MMIDHETDQRQRAWLRRFAPMVRKRLIGADLASVRPPYDPEVRDSESTDGWSVAVADPTVAGTFSVSLFVDTLPNAGRPILWSGFFITGDKRARAMARKLEQVWRKIVTLPASRFMVEDEHTYADPPLRVSEYDRPLLELFDEGGKTIGAYWSERVPWQRRPSAHLADRVALFLSDALGPLEGFALGRTRTASAVFRNERVEVMTTIARRSRTQAKAALQRDGWRCQVCGLEPTSRYGAVGRACLEAHHIRALAVSGKRATTKLGDLVAVCANCHRILGKLPPDQRGLRALRRRTGFRVRQR